MKRFLAVQNIIHLKKRLDAEDDPERRAIIERLLTCEEELLLLDEPKLSGRLPSLVRSPDICGGPTPRLVPTQEQSRWAHTISSDVDFDHRRCPDCEGLMRLVYVQPRQLHRDDGYDVHHYRCENCLNGSRFVFERPSGEDRHASLVQIGQSIADSQRAARKVSRSGKR
jgi:hypothetical protein